MAAQIELLLEEIKGIVGVSLSEKEIEKIKQVVEGNLGTAAINELKTALTDGVKDELKNDEEFKNTAKAELSNEIQQKVSRLEQLEKDLETKNTEVQQLQQKNKELEDKNKTIKQPKQSKSPTYTATAGMGLATGLGVFTVLEYTVRLEMLVKIGIAVALASVASGVTYAVLPSTQVDGAKAQEVNNNGKGK